MAESARRALYSLYVIFYGADADVAAVAPWWGTPVIAAGSVLVGAVLAYFANARLDRGRRQSEERTRREERRAALYVEVLTQVRRDWVPALRAMGVIVVGQHPADLTVDEWLNLQARLDAFGSDAVRSMYHDLRDQLHVLVHAQTQIEKHNGASLERARKGESDSESDREARERLIEKTRSGKVDCEERRDRLEQQIRRELGSDRS